MLTIIESYQQIAATLKEVYPKLSEFEILTLSIQIERNKLLENGLNVSRKDESPVALEAIAAVLGYDKKNNTNTILEVLNDIAIQ